MCKKALVKWSLWISVIAGIYCYLYLVTLGQLTVTSVIPGWQLLAATFTAFPIYFTAGAKREDFLNFAGSFLCGVLWSMVYLWIMDRLNTLGVDVWVNMSVVVAVICFIECSLHFTVLAKLPISHVSAQFGAICNAFWCSNATVAALGAGSTSVGGFYNFSGFGVLAITLVGGAFLALVCNEGANFIDAETGAWKFGNRG